MFVRRVPHNKHWIKSALMSPWSVCHGDNSVSKRCSFDAYHLSQLGTQVNHYSYLSTTLCMPFVIHLSKWQNTSKAYLSSVGYLQQSRNFGTIFDEFLHGFIEQEAYEQYEHVEPGQLTRSYLTVEEPSSVQDLKNFEMQLRQEKKFNARMITVFLLKRACYLKSLSMGKLILKYAEGHPDLEVGLAELREFLILCHVVGTEVSMDEQLEELILSTHGQMCQITSVFDHESCEILIKALCLTKQWKTSIKYFKMTCDQPEDVLSVLAPVFVKALKENQFTVSNSLIEETNRSRLREQKSKSSREHLRSLKLYSEMFIEYVQACERKCYPINKLFELCSTGRLEWTLSASATECIQQYYNRVEPTTVCRKGILFEEIKHRQRENTIKERVQLSIRRARPECSVCKRKLQSFELKEKEFEMAKKAFFQIFNKLQNSPSLGMQPKEFQRSNMILQRLAKESPPIQFVIDGSNVAYLTKSQFLSNILNVVQQLIKLEKGRILVVINYTQKFLEFQDLKRELSKYGNHVKMLSIHKNEKEDLYVLYAALLFGFQTKIVTNDGFNDYSDIITHQESLPFRKWLKARQVNLIENLVNEDISLLMPRIHDFRIQSSELGWHVPYFGNDVTNFIPSNVVCVQNRKK